MRHTNKDSSFSSLSMKRDDQFITVGDGRGPVFALPGLAPYMSNLVFYISMQNEAVRNEVFQKI